MNELTNKQQAVELHSQIMTKAELLAVGIVELGKDLRQMRDSKLYLELGCNDFESYTTQHAQIGERQAYNFIRVYEQYGQSKLEQYASLGITKLVDCLAIPPHSRDDFIEQNDIANISTRELKELIDKSTNQGKQISLLTEQLEQTKTTEQQLSELKEQNQALSVKLREIEQAPIEVAVQELSADEIAEIKADIVKNVQAKAEQELKQAISEKDRQIEQVKEEALDRAEQKLQQATEKAVEQAKAELMEQLNTTEHEKAELLERTTKLEKELSLSADTGTAKVLAHFDTLQTVVEQLVNAITEISSEVDRANFSKAVNKYLSKKFTEQAE